MLRKDESERRKREDTEALKAELGDDDGSEHRNRECDSDASERQNRKLMAALNVETENMTLNFKLRSDDCSER